MGHWLTWATRLPNTLSRSRKCTWRHEDLEKVKRKEKKQLSAGKVLILEIQIYYFCGSTPARSGEVCATRRLGGTVLSIAEWLPVLVLNIRPLIM